MTAQEGYFIDKDTYTGSAGDLTGNYGLITSSGTVLTVSGNQTTYSIRSYNSKAGSYAVTYTVQGPGGDIAKIVP